MNRHKYIGWTEDDPTPRHIIGGLPSKWIFSATVTHSTCPKCLSEPGFHCETPKGRKAWPPHFERGMAYQNSIEKEEFNLRHSASFEKRKIMRKLKLNGQVVKVRQRRTKHTGKTGESIQVMMDAVAIGRAMLEKRGLGGRAGDAIKKGIKERLIPGWER